MKSCDGCGECCQEKICKLGINAYPGAAIPCPGLVWEKGRYWCKLAEKDLKVAQALGIGKGCSKNINPRLDKTDNLKDIMQLIQSLESAGGRSWVI